jgi:hypothetical protein
MTTLLSYLAGRIFCWIVNLRRKRNAPEAVTPPRRFPSARTMSDGRCDPHEARRSQVMAAAERRNGISVNSLPFPTPAIDKNGELPGAGGMLVSTIESYQFMPKELCSDIDALRSALVEQALSVFTIEDIKNLMTEIAVELDQRGPRTLN